MDESEKGLLTRLSVFSGGCTLEALETICEDACGPDPLAGLSALVDNNLVDNNLVVQQDMGDEPRFTMLESIRAYALEKLEAGGEAEAVRERHSFPGSAVWKPSTTTCAGRSRGRRRMGRGNGTLG